MLGALACRNRKDCCLQIGSSRSERISEALNTKLAAKEIFLSLGFSKKLDNLAAAVALHVAYHNFCRVHRTLRTTPAMAAEVTDHVWELDELLQEVEKAE